MKINIKTDKEIYVLNKDFNAFLTFEVFEIDYKIIKKININYGFVFYTNLGKKSKIIKKNDHNKTNELDFSYSDYKINNFENYITVTDIALPIIYPRIIKQYSGLIPFIKITIIFKGFQKKITKYFPLNIKLNSNIIDKYLIEKNVIYYLWKKQSKVNKLIYETQKILLDSHNNSIKSKKCVNKIFDLLENGYIESSNEKERNDLKNMLDFTYQMIKKSKIIGENDISNLNLFLEKYSFYSDFEKKVKKINDDPNYIKLPEFNKFLGGIYSYGNDDYISKEVKNELINKFISFRLFYYLGNSKYYKGIHNYISGFIGDTRIFFLLGGLVTYVIVQFSSVIDYILYLRIITIFFIILLIISLFYQFNIIFQSYIYNKIINYYYNIKFVNKKKLKKIIQNKFEDGKIYELFEIFDISNLTLNNKLNIRIFIQAVIRTWYVPKSQDENILKNYSDEIIYILPLFGTSFNSKFDKNNLVNGNIYNSFKEIYIKTLLLTKGIKFFSEKKSRLYYKIIVDIDSDQLPDLYIEKYIG